MKQIICLFLVAVLAFSAVGCAVAKPKLHQPVQFYYAVSNIAYDGSSILASEVRESADYENQIVSLLNAYLKGPESTNLRSPFPTGLSVTDYSVIESTALLSLSSGLSELSGIELTVACACIATTVFGIDETVNRIEISASGAQLDGKNAITMERDNILFHDTPEETTPAGT